MEIQIEEIKERLRDYLSKECLKESGSILYSSVTTLKKGDFYILGLNPGGISDGQQTIGKCISYLHEKTKNSYTDEEWFWRDKNGEVGTHPLQKSLIEIFKSLNTKLSDVFACNLIFRRTATAQGLKINEADDYWGVHKFFLDIIQPKIIFTIGNAESNSAYSFLRGHVNKEVQEEKKEFLYSNKIVAIKVFRTDKYTVIGLPHLSRYSYISKNKFFFRMAKQNS